MNTTNNKKIIKKIVDNIYGIFVEAETFLMHRSFTKLKGGFRIKLTGLNIYKVSIVSVTWRDIKNILLIKGTRRGHAANGFGQKSKRNAQ